MVSFWTSDNNTVKLVYNDHPWDPQIKAVFTGGQEFIFCNESSKWYLKISVVEDSWLLFRGGRKLRFDCSLMIQINTFGLLFTCQQYLSDGRKTNHGSLKIKIYF